MACSARHAGGWLACGCVCCVWLECRYGEEAISAEFFNLRAAMVVPKASKCFFSSRWAMRSQIRRHSSSSFASHLAFISPANVQGHRRHQPFPSSSCPLGLSFDTNPPLRHALPPMSNINIEELWQKVLPLLASGSAP